jgi:hypothetical protein
MTGLSEFFHWNCPACDVKSVRGVQFDSHVQIEIRKSATLAEGAATKFAPPQSLLRRKVKKEFRERIPRERV